MAMLQHALHHVVAEIVPAQVDGLTPTPSNPPSNHLIGVLQELLDEPHGALLQRAVLHEAADDATTETVPREALDRRQQLVADEGARGGAQLLDDLLQHVVRVRRLRGLAHVAVELQRDRLYNM